MPIPGGGEVLFDAPLEPVRPLAELWNEAANFRRSLRLHQASGLVLRAYTQDAFDSNEVPISIAERLALVSSHLEQLQEFGLCVVSHATELAEAPEDRADSIVAYGAARYVKDAHRIDSPEVSSNISRPKVQEFVIKPLQRYYEWCRAAAIKTMISDIFEPHQFSLDLSSRVVFMHDVDPYLTNYVPGDMDMPDDYTDPLIESHEIDRDFANIGR